MENDKGRDEIVLSGAVPADCVAVILYTTFPTREAAVNAGRSLVERRLAGCVNIIPAMTSIYVWDGKTEIADEAVLLAKMPAQHLRPRQKRCKGCTLMTRQLFWRCRLQL